MSEIKQRGRPRSDANPKTSAADEAIGRTVWNLVTWGFPLRSRGVGHAGVCEVVGIGARSILQREDHEGFPLSPDRVEQIFEKWFVREQATRKAARRWPLMERWRYTKESLVDHRPDKRLSLDELAAKLLSNGGNWIGPRPIMPAGDFIISPKADSLLGPVPKFEFVENGVEK